VLDVGYCASYRQRISYSQNLSVTVSLTYDELCQSFFQRWPSSEIRVWMSSMELRNLDMKKDKTFRIITQRQPKVNEYMANYNK
jgi:hypothetical protein